jgi:putative N6-adenine-specific DNA methylase
VTAARRVRHECFAVCAPGLEPILAGELAALGIRAGRHHRGGVDFSATTRQLYLANLWLRSAGRVLVRVASFRATSFARLEQEAAATPWNQWLTDDVMPVFRVSSTASQLYHTQAIAERLRRVAAEHATLPHDGMAEQRFVVRVARDQVTISVDSSGENLHRRGWRLATARAPLRETLAAGVLLGVGWDGSVPLVDPFCGSGTIVIEAALIARRAAPGLSRRFAFGGWPTFEPGTWASVTGEAHAAVLPHAEVPIVGSDRDEGAVESAMANAERAGMAADVTFERRSISDAAPPPGDAGWLLTNPPYGTRVSGGHDLRDLYARLGQVIGERFAAWSVGVLVADRRLAGHSGLSLEPVLETVNGGIPVTLLAARPG